MGVESVNISPALATVLNRAGDRSDVDFDYLVQTAVRESSLNPHARAQSSSAVGLFQFIESTWLEVLKQEGPRLGYEQYANAIERTSDGNYVIEDNGVRAQVLAMREDPQMSADLAAAFTRTNGEYLSQRFGRHPSPGELYIAHFMGARGAERLFEAGLDNPDQIAAEIFPRQARANPSIFNGSEGPRTIRGVYQSLIAQHDQSAVSATRPQAPASQAFTPQIPLSRTPALQAPFAEVSGSPTNTPADKSSSGAYIPSRYGPPITPEARSVTFDNLFSATGRGPATPSAGTGAAAVPTQSAPNTVTIDPGAAFFAQLYNQ